MCKIRVLRYRRYRRYRRYLPTNWLLPLKEYCGMSQLCKVASLSPRLPIGRLERPPRASGAIHLRSEAPSTRPVSSDSALESWSDGASRGVGRETERPGRAALRPGEVGPPSRCFGVSRGALGVMGPRRGSPRKHHSQRNAQGQPAVP